jgi:transcriptional regulator GlxA family with amidase domain
VVGGFVQIDGGFEREMALRCGRRRPRSVAEHQRLRHRVLANPEAAASPLIVGSTARLLAATALATFPNTALPGPGVRDRRDASPATLRRAIAFIDEHVHDDIVGAEIAAAAGVTIRAAQLAFRRHLDTTPLGYLRRLHRKRLAMRR